MLRTSNYDSVYELTPSLLKKAEILTFAGQHESYLRVIQQQQQQQQQKLQKQNKKMQN